MFDLPALRAPFPPASERWRRLPVVRRLGSAGAAATAGGRAAGVRAAGAALADTASTGAPLAGALLVGALLLGAPLLDGPLASAWAASPPVAARAERAPSHPVTEVIHGVTVVDPYRNLEAVNQPETRAWLDAEGRRAADQLAAIDGRDALAARVAALAKATGDSVYGLKRMPGERLYYLKRKAGESQYKLMLRIGRDGDERVLVDPQRLAATTGVPHALNYYMPSWDGQTLAYGISAGGSEDATLNLMSIATGEAIGAPIPRVHEALVNWSPDSRSLTYNQVRQLPPGTPDTETFLDTTVYLLRLGAKAGPPRPLFGPLVEPSLGLARLDVGAVFFSPDSRYMVARTTDTTLPEGRIYVAPVATLGRKHIPWRRIATAADQITDAQLRGDTLYLRSHAGAPRGRLLALDLRQPDLARARVVIPEPEQSVFQSFSLGRDAIYAEMHQGFNSRVQRFVDAGGPTTEAVPAAPGIDVAPSLAGSTFAIDDPAHRHGDVWLSTSSWTEPRRIMAVPAAGAPIDTGLLRNSLPEGAPEIEVAEVRVPSHDGALVPLAILQRKGLPRDGNNPTLLIGYGAYGFPIDARFDPRSIAWLERGGIIAYADVRGGGAYGEAWRLAGFKATKPNTWKDGIACARYLIDQGYASPKTLGIWGTSAGGIFVGRAVTEAPELFAAAIFDVGIMDAVRAEESANGITNISEFGTVKDPAEFRALLEMSTYHHIEDGVAYPAVLLVHGLNDPRVDVWHSAKAAARLQAANPGGKPVLLRLDGQAGHGVGSTAEQGYSKQADIYAFLLWQFGKLGTRGGATAP